MARPLVAREPNERLSSLIQEMGGTNAGLARRVNMCGAEHGVDLRYDKTSVSRWLRGQRPRGRTPALIAEVLSSKLGRPITVDDIGMSVGEQGVVETGFAYADVLSDAIDTMGDLWRRDASRRGSPGGAAVDVAALLTASRDWLSSDRDAAVSYAGGQRVGAADIEMVRRVTRELVRLDHRFGSGRVRPMAVHYLNDVVSGLLSGTYGDATGRELFAVSARLVELVGYMSVDAGRPGIAQRYYVQALRLSQAADDRAFGSYVLAAGMSRLAASRGLTREVVQLARAAQEGGRGHTTPGVDALLYAAEARGHAMLGNALGCDRAAGMAQDALGRACSADEPEWIAYFDRAYLADELTHCNIALRRHGSAVSLAAQALEYLPSCRVRRRTIDHFLLAVARLRSGEVEEACGTAIRGVELLANLWSGLGKEYLGEFRRAVRRFEREAAVLEFEETLKTLGEGILT